MGQIILKWEEIDIAAPEYLRINRTTNIQYELSVRECEAILAQIIEIKVSQSESMPILELVQGLQTIRSSQLENG